MVNYSKSLNDWRIWLIILLIILVLIWLFLGAEAQEFQGINFGSEPPKDNKIPEIKKRPKRMTSEGEEDCRRIIQKLTRKEFPPADNIPWLISPETNKHLKLDGYNPELGIAFEFQGRQHYHYTPRFHGDDKSKFIRQVRNDRFKREQCLANKVWLIIIPYHVDKSKREEFIINSLPGSR